MREGHLVFAQVMRHIPLKAFSRMVERHCAQHKVKEFTCLGGPIPSFIHISNGKMADVRILDALLEQGLIEAGAYYVMDRAYVDFARLHRLNAARAFFVTRAKDNLLYEIVRRKAVNTLTGLISDQQIRLTGAVSSKRYPDVLRLVVFFDEDTGKKLEFLTNNLMLPSMTICALYKQRWQVELFFKWIKQHLRIKTFFGTSENAVKTQIWIAISTYVLIAIVRKRLRLDHSLHEILRVLNLNLFETMPIPDLLNPSFQADAPTLTPVQGNLFPTLGH